MDFTMITFPPHHPNDPSQISPCLNLSHFSHIICSQIRKKSQNDSEDGEDSTFFSLRRQRQELVPRPQNVVDEPNAISSLPASSRSLFVGRRFCVYTGDDGVLEMTRASLSHLAPLTNTDTLPKACSTLCVWGTEENHSSFAGMGLKT